MEKLHNIPYIDTYNTFANIEKIIHKDNLFFVGLIHITSQFSIENEIIHNDFEI